MSISFRINKKMESQNRELANPQNDSGFVERALGVIDPFDVLGNHPARIDVNPLGNIIQAYEDDLGELNFATENTNQTLIKEPPSDEKHAYWRDEPRGIKEAVQLSFLARNPDLLTPGGLWSAIADPELLDAMLNIEAEEAEEPLRSMSCDLKSMRTLNSEHWVQHRRAAIKSLRIFAAGSPLHSVGRSSDATLLELLQENYILTIVLPQRHMDRLAPYVGLLANCAMEAQLSGRAGATDFYLEEVANTPVSGLLQKAEVLRAYKTSMKMVAQSPAGLEQAYSKQMVEMLESNTPIKQWYGFLNAQESERVSRAIGEELVLKRSLGLSQDKNDIQETLGLENGRILSSEELMRLPEDEMIMHIRGVGFGRYKKPTMWELAPYCYDLGDNPREPEKRPLPDKKITLPTEL